MLETFVLIFFAVSLVVGIILKLPLYVSLFFGFLLFSAYGRFKGYSYKDLADMSLQGIRTIGPVLLLFVIIGMLTASWRAAGTIPAITCWSSKLIHPSSIVMVTFSLCCLMSMVTGSAFATSATIGVICMTIAKALGADPALVGGAVLSGCFFGDRASPMSSSGMLVATLTNTKPYKNIPRMLKNAIVPTILCLGILFLLGQNFQGSASTDFTRAFARDFSLDWYVVLPTAIIIVMALAKVSVKKAMITSLVVALILAVTVQHYPIYQIPDLLIFGFKTNNEQIAPMVNGGGILSMANLCLVIGIASTYSGLFEGTGLLNGLRTVIIKLSRKTTPFVGVLLTAIITTCIACDQMLSIMLTFQLTDKIEAHGEALALDLENSSVIISAFVPWTTSCMGCLAFMGAPTISVLYAFFPMLMSLWFLALSIYERQKPEFVETIPAHIMGLEEKDDCRRYLSKKELGWE